MFRPDPGPSSMDMTHTKLKWQTLYAPTAVIMAGNIIINKI